MAGQRNGDSGVLPPQPRPKRVRLADVAELAGVAKSTASRVLNQPGLAVLPETRARVFAAARQLGYRPHAAARGLRRAESGALGLTLPDLTNPVFARMFRGAWQRALEREFAVLILEDLREEAVDETFRQLVQTGRIDGLIVASASPGHPIVASLAANAVPHVFVNRAVSGSGRNVVLDDSTASETAVGHLHELGHVRIGHIAGPRALWTGRARRDAFVRAMERRRLRPDAIGESDFSAAGGARAMRALLEARPDLTAVTVGVHGQAVGVLHALWAAGRSVPDDVSVVSYDDLPEADFLRPALTRIRMPLAELGAAAVDALVAQLAGIAPRDVLVGTRAALVVGGSTAPPSRR